MASPPMGSAGTLLCHARTGERAAEVASSMAAHSLCSAVLVAGPIRSPTIGVGKRLIDPAHRLIA
jgi:hypothetical protein